MDAHLRIWRLLLSIRLSLIVLPKASPTASAVTAPPPCPPGRRRHADVDAAHGRLPAQPGGVTAWLDDATPARARTAATAPAS